MGMLPSCARGLHAHGPGDGGTPLESRCGGHEHLPGSPAIHRDGPVGSSWIQLDPVGRWSDTPGRIQSHNMSQVMMLIQINRDQKGRPTPSGITLIVHTDHARQKRHSRARWMFGHLLRSACSAFGQLSATFLAFVSEILPSNMARHAWRCSCCNLRKS